MKKWKGRRELEVGLIQMERIVNTTIWDYRNYDMFKELSIILITSKFSWLKGKCSERIRNKVRCDNNLAIT